MLAQEEQGKVPELAQLFLRALEGISGCSYGLENARFITRTAASAETGDDVRCKLCSYSTYRHEEPASGIQYKSYCACLEFSPSTAILRTSMEVYEYDLAVLHGHNTFFLKASSPEQLTPLLNLGPKALSQIRFLHIKLNIPDAGYEFDTENPNEALLLEKWADVVDYLKMHVQFQRLRFAFVCQYRNDRTVFDLTNMLESLPPVEQCALSFGCPRDSGTSESIVRKLGWKLAGDKTFPFDRLPKELRLQVLAQTDLVARPRKGEIFRGGFRVEHNRCLFKYEGCCRRCCYSPHDCCCLTGSQNFSSTCICHLDPRPMLLISHLFKADASQVLYANRFCFSIGLYRLEPVFRFFRRRAPSDLYLMRDIVLDLDWYAHCFWLEEKENFMAQWNELVDIVAVHCNLSAMNLTIRCDHYFDEDDWTVTEPLTDTDFQTVRDFYNDIFPCVEKLMGLKAFVVYLRYKVFWDMEQRFEKNVMGEAYSSDNLRVPRKICFQI